MPLLLKSIRYVKSYTPRRSRLFAALCLSLLSATASFAHAPERPAAPSDSLAVPADTCQATPAPAALTPPPAAHSNLNDTLPHIHPRDANGRLTDYTVAPGVTWHYDKPKPLRWALNIPRDLGQ